MRELLKKPQRSQAAPRPFVDKLIEPEEDAVEQQRLINKIVQRHRCSSGMDNKKKPLES